MRKWELVVDVDVKEEEGQLTTNLSEWSLLSRSSSQPAWTCFNTTKGGQDWESVLGVFCGHGEHKHHPTSARKKMSLKIKTTKRSYPLSRKDRKVEYNRLSHYPLHERTSFLFLFFFSVLLPHFFHVPSYSLSPPLIIFYWALEQIRTTATTTRAFFFSFTLCSSLLPG